MIRCRNAFSASKQCKYGGKKCRFLHPGEGPVRRGSIMFLVDPMLQAMHYPATKDDLVTEGFFSNEALFLEDFSYEEIPTSPRLPVFQQITAQ